MASIDLTTTASVPANATLTVTVYQDTDGDGNAENSATQSVDDGTNTYTLSGFQTQANPTYWVYHEWGNTDVTQSADLDSVALDVPTVASGTSTATVSTTGSSSGSSSLTGISTITATSDGSSSGSSSLAGSVTVETSSTGQSAEPVEGVTALPDAQVPTLGNGVEDEIAVTTPDVTDYGDYRFQIRETGTSSWDASALGFDEAIVASDTDTTGDVTTTFAGLEDGEEYEVRVRTETEHRTGAWTAPVSIVTQFPGATNPSVATSTSTSVTVEGTDNADNEDGFRLEREERIEGEWRDRRVVAERGAHSGTGTFTVTDDTPSPDTTYRYRVEAYTEHSAATSSWTAETTTPQLDGVTQTSTGTQGWVVRVEHETGVIHRPRVLAGTRDPSVNDLPSLELTVPRDEKWTQPGFEDASVEVYKDGRWQPVDTLVDTRVQADRHVLVCEGGSELRERAVRTIDQAEADTAARDLITSETSYTADVDDPQSGEVSEFLMQSAGTAQEFRDALPNGVPSDKPWTVDDDSDRVRQLQSCWTRDAEDSDRGSSSYVYADSYSGIGTSSGTGQAVSFASAGDYHEYDITTGYDIAEFELAVRWGQTGSTNSNPSKIEISIDGNALGTWEVSKSGVGWTKLFDAGYILDGNGNTVSAPSLSAGSHTIRFEAVTTGDNPQNVDVVAPYDAQYSRTFDNTVTTAADGYNYLDGPGWYLDSVPVVFEDAITDLAVLEGRFTGTFTDTSSGQAIALSNDQGSNYPISGANTSSVEGAFPSSGGSIRARVTLSSYGTAERTPAQRRQTQALSSYSLYATLDDTPLLINKDYDGSVLQILQQMADAAGAVFAVLPTQDEGYKVAWTWPRQRKDPGLDPSLVDYQGSRTTRGRAGAAVVKGANQSVGREEWTATLDTWFDLSYSRLQATSVDVWDPSGQVDPTENEDYEVDRAGGRLKALSSGALSDGATYAVSYEWQTQGSYTSPDVPDPREVSETVAALSSNRACGQAARRLVEVLQTPRYSAELQVPTEEFGWNVIEALQLREFGFPEDVWLQVRSGSSEPGQASFRVGRGQTFSEAVDEIRSRVSAVESLV